MCFSIFVVFMFYVFVRRVENEQLHWIRDIFNALDLSDGMTKSSVFDSNFMRHLPNQ